MKKYRFPISLNIYKKYSFRKCICNNLHDAIVTDITTYQNMCFLNFLTNWRGLKYRYTLKK